MKKKTIIIFGVIISCLIFINHTAGPDYIKASISPTAAPYPYKDSDSDDITISGDFSVDIIRKAYFTPKGTNQGEVATLSWYSSSVGGSDYIEATSYLNSTIYPTYTGPCSVSVTAEKNDHLTSPNIVTFAMCKMIW